MSKGGSSSQTTEIPAWLENAAIQNINKANDVSNIGYTPYYGPDVAALSPMQQQSMQSTGNAASAFGLAPQGFDAMAGMPQAQTFANGMQGYSSAPLYQESVDQFQANRPAQFQAMADMFIDPFTGAAARNNYQASPAQVQQMFNNGNGGGGGGGGSGNYAMDMAIASGNQEAIDAINSYGTPNSVDTSGSGNLIGAVMDLFGGGNSFNAPVSDLTRPNINSAYESNGNEQAEAQAIQGLLDNLSFGGSDNSRFSSANTPTSKVEQADNRIVSDSGKGESTPTKRFVKPDRNFPRAVTEDLSLKAEAKPYKSGSKTPKKRKARTARAGYTFGL